MDAVRTWLAAVFGGLLGLLRPRPTGDTGQRRGREVVKRQEDAFNAAFPQAYVWINGNFYVLCENGDVIMAVEQAGDYRISYDELRELVSKADRFMFARERRIE